MNKCEGCGVELQIINKDNLGYTKNIENNYCERCFRITNYNEYIKVFKSNEDYIKILNVINKTNDLVLLIVDLFNINNIDEILKYLNKKVLLVLTKRDLLPKSVKDEKLIEYFRKYNSKVLDIIVISSNKNYNFDNLFDKINEYKISNEVYIVGYTNAGKSTLINKLIYNYSEYSSKITTSMLPSTTIDLIKIKLNNSLTLVDTPGILDKSNIIDKLDNKTIKKILPKKEIKPITYQLKKGQVLLIEDLVRIDGIQDVNLTFFMSNGFKYERLSKSDRLLNLHKHEIKVNNEDIVINGLGFIKVNKATKIILYTLEDVLVYTRKSLI